MKAFTLTTGDVLLIAWLRIGVWRVNFEAMNGEWNVKTDSLDQRLGDYGMGRN